MFKTKIPQQLVEKTLTELEVTFLCHKSKQFQYVFSPEIKAVKSFLDDSDLGEVLVNEPVSLKPQGAPSHEESSLKFNVTTKLSKNKFKDILRPSGLMKKVESDFQTFITFKDQKDILTFRSEAGSDVQLVEFQEKKIHKKEEDFIITINTSPKQSPTKCEKLIDPRPQNYQNERKQKEEPQQYDKPKRGGNIDRNEKLLQKSTKADVQQEVQRILCNSKPSFPELEITEDEFLVLQKQLDDVVDMNKIAQQQKIPQLKMNAYLCLSKLTLSQRAEIYGFVKEMRI